MRQRYPPDSATTSASSGSPRSAVTSFTITAPSSSARRATSAFEVSTETGQLAGDRLEHGHDPAQLLVRAHALRPGPGRLAAHVDERGPFCGQPSRLAHGSIRIEELAAVREASGVTLTTPMTLGRGSNSSMDCQGAHPARVRSLPLACLPGVDDGARDDRGQPRLARRRRARHAAIAATPHVRHDYPTTPDRMEARQVAALRRDFSEQGIPVQILHGGELDLQGDARAQPG